MGLRAADDGYLQHSTFDLKLIADGFGPASADVFEAMRSDPSLVVIPGSLLDDTQGEQGQQIDRGLPPGELRRRVDVPLRDRSARAEHPARSLI